ncbi:hypothetical protein BCR42DRAFT_414487, partial [Absidia repens]
MSHLVSVLHGSGSIFNFFHSGLVFHTVHMAPRFFLPIRRTMIVDGHIPVLIHMWFKGRACLCVHQFIFWYIFYGYRILSVLVIAIHSIFFLCLLKQEKKKKKSQPTFFYAL